jgi:hypothetical protein
MSDSLPKCSDIDTPDQFDIWLIGRLYEQLLAFIIIILIFLINSIELKPQTFISFISWIIILISGQFTYVYVVNKLPNLVNDPVKSKKIFDKMIRFSLPLLFLLFLGIMIAQLFSKDGMTVIQGKNINTYDIFIITLGFIFFIVTLLIRKNE